MRVVLVRHGETALNAKGVYRGRAEVPLSLRGRAQSKAVGRALRGVSFDGIHAKLFLMNDTCHLGRVRDVVEGIIGSGTPMGASRDDERQYRQWRK